MPTEIIRPIKTDKHRLVDLVYALNSIVIPSMETESGKLVAKMADRKIREVVEEIGKQNL